MVKKLNFEEVKKYFGDNGCELLETTYQNNVIPMRYRCVCGEISTIRFNNFKKGSRCKYCGLEKSNNTKSHDIDYARQCFEEAGCELLEEAYKNNYTPMEYRCSCGEESKIRLFCLLKGQRCEKCGKKRGANHYNWNPDRNQVEHNRKFSQRQRQFLKYVLKKLGKEKTSRTHRMLGYNAQELREHIELHFNWNNVKDNVWHIDHIFPIKAFLDYGIEDVKLINCLDNLQPLSDIENFSKNRFYDKEEFERWLKERIVEE